MNPLISTAALKAWLADTDIDLRVVDCGFDLTDAAAGARAFEAGHLPGAVYLHLDDDLSSPRTGLNGRHPLPQREAFAATLAAIGVGPETKVVAYDAAGAAYASRLWWMLQWVGLGQAYVLDGGMAAWRACGGAIETGPASPRAALPALAEDALPVSRVPVVDYASLRAGVGGSSITTAQLIVDARASDRFRGENETLDPVAGHIPGAVNRCFRDNLASDGRFKAADQLRAEWSALIGQRAPSDLVHQCGSGVTACHNLLALAAAGLPGGSLYPGSWSEWCAQPGAPVALGR